jgi:hypothetical protein
MRTLKVPLTQVDHLLSWKNLRNDRLAFKKRYKRFLRSLVKSSITIKCLRKAQLILMEDNSLK